MKRKQFLINAGAASLAAFLGGCKGFLDQAHNSSAVEESNYFTNLEQARTSVAVTYRYIDYDSWWQTANWRYWLNVSATDNAWDGNTYQSHPTEDAIGHYTVDGNNTRLEAPWIMYYKSIGRTNSVMAGVEKAPISDNNKAQLIAELKFIRSYCYFELVRNLGGVPLVLKVYSPDTHLPRSTAEECYKQVIEDLSEGADILPKKSEYAQSERFRASRGAALSLMAKVYLYMENWEKAETAAKQVMELDDYDLESDFGTLWSYNYNNGVESIFEIQFADSEVPALPPNTFMVALNSPMDGGWGYASVTSDLENAYIDEGDDIRRQWTINKQGEPVAGDPDVSSFDGGGYPNNKSKSGRYPRKWYIPKGQRPADNRRAFDDKILRFADVLLIHAEAAAMQNKPAIALSSLKRIRDRVDLITDMSLSGWDLINAVRKERRLEMAYEGDRLFDIRRWKDQSGQPVINSIMGPDGSFVTYNIDTSTDEFEMNNKIESQDKGIHFDPGKHLLWPIPEKQIVLSGGIIEQNSGY